MPHLILLGDSIFDNQSYVPPGEAVFHHLRSLLPVSWHLTLLAVDGSTTASIPAQLARLPAEATHLVLSVGGNDALGHLGILEDRVSNVGEALIKISENIREFETNYQEALRIVLAIGLPTTICTIYPGWFVNEIERKKTSAALPFFNDVILRSAFQERLPVIDLRLVCTEPADYAHSIEPSSQGGYKIAQAIVAAVVTARQSARLSEIYAL